MATNTSILGLTKPTYAEDQDVTVLNGNFDLIDAEAGRTRANFAGTYSATDTYAVGDYCIYQGNLYRCTTAISSGEAWNSAHWSQASAGAELSSAKQDIANFVKYNTETAEIDNNGYFTTTLKSKDNAIISIVSVFVDNYYRNAFRYEVLEYGGSDNTYTALRFIFWDGTIIGKNKSATVKYAYIEI